jgi:hypothetical protein
VTNTRERISLQRHNCCHFVVGQAWGGGGVWGHHGYQPFNHLLYTISKFSRKPKKIKFVSKFKHLSHVISIICLSPSHVPQQQRKLSTSNFRAPMEQRGVSHYGLAIYIKKISLRQKKNYENSNISPCKNYITFKKNPLKQTKIL